MAAWNLESVGTKGLGGGGGLICGKVARAWINKKKQNDRAAYDGVGIFKDPMMDAVYGQCTSSTRAGVPRPDGIEDLLKPTALERALAEARAHAMSSSQRESDERSAQSGQGDDVAPGARSRSRRQGEDVQVVFEEPFTSRGGRKTAMPLVCLGSGEHTIFVIKVKYNGRVWSVERRFSEFDELDKELARMPAREGRTVHLPPFPSKVWVGKAAQETQDRRRRELEAYVQALVRQPAVLQASPHLRAFLELPPRPPSDEEGRRESVGQLPAAGAGGRGDATLENPYAARLRGDGGGGASGSLGGRGGARGVGGVRASWSDRDDDEASL